jgi:peptidoglycan glycosyltransferase
MALVFPRVFATCVVCCTLHATELNRGSAQDLPKATLASGAQASLRGVENPSSALPPASVDGFALVKRARVSADKLWSTLDSGEAVQLTIEPDLQAHIQRVLALAAPPRAALVALEPATGRVLAYVNHAAGTSLRDAAADPAPPAASVFKLVTTAALLDAGVRPDTRTCYGGGLSRLMPADLVDNPKRDAACATLAEALGGSVNAVFAKLADRHLTPRSLSRFARAFGFGERLPSQLRVLPSRAELPSDRLEFARAAAGFWHTHLSPLHGALIASAVANAGVMPRATLLERRMSRGGQLLQPERANADSRRVMGPAAARALGTIMQRTVRQGTSRAAFYDARGRPYLPGIEVAGKTGSLSDGNPYRAYSWWVGFAPADKPRIAIAALVVNGAKWRIKASALARDTLQYALKRAR